MIKLLSNDQIDRAQWDKAIESSPYGLIYALSWYLDIVCPDWEALVSDNYEQVMPLPVKNKMGLLKYPILPTFTQQLGIFGQKIINTELTSEFVKNVKRQYNYSNFSLNASNDISLLNDCCHNSGVTYILNLEKTITDIENAFSSNHVRNIKKAKEYKLNYASIPDIDFFLKFIDKHLPVKFGKKELKSAYHLYHEAFKRGMAEIVATSDEDKNILSMALWFNFNKRRTYILPATSSEGKEKRANFWLIYQYILLHANKDEVIDFEGSRIESLARFYAGFGAEKTLFPHFHFNNLPFPLKMVKK